MEVSATRAMWMTQFLVCAECGGPLTAHPVRGKREKMRVTCARHPEHEGVMDRRKWQAQRAEAWEARQNLAQALGLDTPQEKGDVNAFLDTLS